MTKARDIPIVPLEKDESGTEKTVPKRMYQSDAATLTYMATMLRMKIPDLLRKYVNATLRMFKAGMSSDEILAAIDKLGGGSSK